jgi:hypothetical protein
LEHDGIDGMGISAAIIASGPDRKPSPDELQPLDPACR